VALAGAMESDATAGAVEVSVVRAVQPVRITATRTDPAGS
jgi:hypothetical protein